MIYDVRKNIQKVADKVAECKSLSKKETISMLETLFTSSDFEVTHALADKILIRYINDDEIAEAYNRLDKFYA